LSRTENTIRISTSETSKIAALWSERLNVDVGDGFRSLSKVEFWQCNDTGLRWFEPPQSAGTGDLYSQLEKFDWYYMPEKWEFDIARSLLRTGAQVLEVGVGFGFFLESCRSAGFDISGVEMSSTAAQRARKNGFEVFEEDLLALANRVGEGQFDAICSFQVLEHVPQPREFLEGMLANVKVGGQLILSVPNAAVIQRIDPDHQNLFNQPPHHMGYWDETVFRSLETTLPVKVRSVHREPMASYHVAWIVSGYLRNILSPLGKTLPRLLINRYSTLPLQWILKAGPRKLLPGHTILVELEKIG